VRNSSISELASLDAYLNTAMALVGLACLGDDAKRFDELIGRAWRAYETAAGILARVKKSEQQQLLSVKNEQLGNAIRKPPT